MSKKSRYHEVARKRMNRKIATNCDNKKRYTDIAQAFAGAMRTIESVEHIDEMFYYKCNLCHGYHLTKNKGNGAFLCEV